MATDSVSAHVAAQQKKWEEYLAKHAVEKIYRDMTAEMIADQPESPVKFMYAYLAKNYPEVTAGADGGGAPAAAVPTSTSDGVQTDAAAGDDDCYGSDEEGSDDDDNDYADFIPAKPVDKTKKRGSIVAEKVEVADDWVPPNYEKPEADVKFVAEILPRLFFLSGLTRKEINVLVSAMQEVKFDAGTAIIEQGAEGDMFYIVKDGICDIDVEGVGKVMELPCPSKEDPDVLRRYFGELALLYDAPRAATVRARDAVTCFALDRKTFKSILQDTATKQRLLYGEFLAGVPLFKGLAQDSLNSLCDSLMAKDFDEGDVVIKEGDTGNDFYIIETGTAECTQNIAGNEVSVCPTLGSGAFFGELALLKDAPRAATVTAASKLATVRVDRPTFKRMIGDLATIKKDYTMPAN